MGNIITKVTTNNIPLDESNVSDITICDVAKEKSPAALSQQKSSGMLKNLFNFDPRSPTAFINRTPIAIFRNNSKNKFNHQALNESIETQVDLEILTPEEEESLGSCSDIFIESEKDAKDIELLNDPRSPIVEIARTPIVADNQPKSKKEEKLMKKLAEKLVATNLEEFEDAENDEKKEDRPTKKSSKNNKKFIFEDDENNFDRFSTPPKGKAVTNVAGEGRTPLSSLNNSNKPKSRIPTSTPKSKTHLMDGNGINLKNSSTKIPRSSRRLH